MTEEPIRRFVERVKDRFELHGALLFGSRARGDYGPWSDYDVLLIGEFPMPYLERQRAIMELTAEASLPIEPHAYTLEEALEMLNLGHPVIVDAIEEGIKLLVGPGLTKLLERYRELKGQGRLMRTSTTIIF